MTQVGEGIAILVNAMEKDEKCDFKPEATAWQANLDGSGTKLGNALGDKPNANSESELSGSNWPSQAHHLIPHKTLVKHQVADWLKKDKQIYDDTKYNVDHQNNGKWMPYASSLPEWTSASPVAKRELMFKIMRLAKIQMHQGKHSESNRYGIGEMPYKARVKQYLDKINNNAQSHYKGPRACEDCKGKKQANKCPPRNNTVTYVDKASRLINKDIDSCKIFVSRIAAEFAQTGGFN